MRRYAIDLVVRGHYVQSVRRMDRGGEGRKEHFAKSAFGNGGGAGVGAALGLTMPGHVFERREHPARCKREGVALKSTCRGDSEWAHEVRVFAVRFLDSAPAWVAGDVDDGRQG